MASGVNIAKANIAVASHPPARVAIAKANVAVASRDETAAAGRRRPLFVS